MSQICRQGNQGFPHRRGGEPWERAALDVNPHWELRVTKTDEEEAAEKKDNSASENE